MIALLRALFQRREDVAALAFQLNYRVAEVAELRAALEDERRIVQTQAGGLRDFAAACEAQASEIRRLRACLSRALDLREMTTERTALCSTTNRLPRG